MKMKNSRKPKYLGKKTKLNQDNPDKFVLDPLSSSKINDLECNLSIDASASFN